MDQRDIESYGGQDLGLQRTESLSMDPELFEKLFLTPQTEVSGDLRMMFGVPTPLALVGFGVALTPLSICLMGWRGSGQTYLGAADLGSYFWFGGLLVEIAAVGEFLLGNTFALVIFAGYGAWFMVFAATLVPFYNATGAYAADTSLTLTEAHAAGLQTAGFAASFGFQVTFMAVLTFVFLVCSFRVNVIFVLLLTGGLIAFILLAAANFVEAEAFMLLAEGAALGDTAAGALLVAKGEKRLSVALKLVTGGGGAFFGAAMLGWYLTLSIMLAVVDMPIKLPVFDLSTKIKGRTQLMQERVEKER